MKQKNFRGAEKALGKALRLEPANANYPAELGFVYLELGFPTRARVFFERALKISPDNARGSDGLTKTKYFDQPPVKSNLTLISCLTHITTDSIYEVFRKETKSLSDAV